MSTGEDFAVVHTAASPARTIWSSAFKT